MLDSDDVPQWRTEGPVPRFSDEWHPDDRLLAPMYATAAGGGELIGVVSVDKPRNGRRPGAWAREALQMYSFQAGIAISNARLRANMQRALVRLEQDQQALRASEESFRQAFEYAPSGMAMAEIGGDQHGKLVRANDALCRLLGRPASVLRRYSFSDLVHPEDIAALLRTSAEGGRAELRLARRDGSYLWVSLRNSVVADTADGPRFLLTHVEDIEERKRHELASSRTAPATTRSPGCPTARNCAPGSAPGCARARSPRRTGRPAPTAWTGEVDEFGYEYSVSAVLPYDHHVHAVEPEEAESPAGQGDPGEPRGSRCSSATWTASSRSTTASGTTPATRC